MHARLSVLMGNLLGKNKNANNRILALISGIIAQEDHIT